MARFQCVCGETIRTSGDIPHPDQWMLVSDEEMLSWSKGESVEDHYRSMTIAFRCPASDHLWIFWDGFDNPPSLYEPNTTHGIR